MLFRSEAYAYAIRHHIEVLNEVGHRTETYLASDGGARSDVWMRIVADVIEDVVRRHGLPPATFQLVHGAAAVGSQLAGDPRVRAISFTGGAPAGRAVATAAAPLAMTLLRGEPAVPSTASPLTPTEVIARSLERPASMDRFWAIWMAHQTALRQRSLRLSGGNRADAEDALLTPVDDAEALAAAIKRMIGSPALAQTLAANGRRRIAAEFSEDAVVRSYIALFEKVRR